MQRKTSGKMLREGSMLIMSGHSILTTERDESLISLSGLSKDGARCVLTALVLVFLQGKLPQTRPRKVIKGWAH